MTDSVFESVERSCAALKLENPSNVHESACMPRVSEKMSTVRPMANDTDSRALMLSDTGSLMINRMKMYGTATLNMQIRLNTKA